MWIDCASTSVSVPRRIKIIPRASLRFAPSGPKLKQNCSAANKNIQNAVDHTTGATTPFVVQTTFEALEQRCVHGSHITANRTPRHLTAEQKSIQLHGTRVTLIAVNYSTDDISPFVAATAAGANSATANGTPRRTSTVCIFL